MRNHHRHLHGGAPDPAGFQPAGVGNQYVMHSTSAESNVLNVAASLGVRTKVLTRFVKDSPIAAFIKGDLRRRGIEFEGPEVEQEGPWGCRHQFNIADTGYGMRGPRVYNDRAGEVGRGICEEDFDLHRLFHEEGAEILHMSGLFAALSPQTGALCLEMAEIARENGTKISFDMNYRASFWKGREAELREIFSRIASAADILIGNEEDFQLALGIPGPESGGRDISEQIDSFREMILRVRDRYPGAMVFANTLREVQSANLHNWGAILYMDGEWRVAEPRPIPVLDRIGGGDGFVSGLLYGILKGWPAQDCLQFGWATGAMAVTMEEDFATPADEQQVWSVWQGNARVKR